MGSLSDEVIHCLICDAQWWRIFKLMLSLVEIVAPDE